MFSSGNLAPVTYGKSAYDSQRWSVVRRAWSEYAVTGVKVEYHPRYFIPTQPGQAQVYGAFYTTMINLSQGGVSAANTGDLSLSNSFKRLDPQKPFTKFISFKKLAKQ